MCSITILGLVVSATSMCDVTLLGDPLLVADIRVRMNLARDDRTRCEPVVVQVEDHPDGVAVLIARDGHRFERVVRDVDRATVLIESRVFVPEEALEPLAELTPRAFVPPPPPAARVEREAEAPRAPRVVFDPRTGAAIATVGADGIVRPSDERPAPSNVRRTVGARLKKLLESSATTAVAPVEERGAGFVVGASGELTIVDDGEAWAGPAVEAAVTDGRWSGGAVLRIAKRPGNGVGTLLELSPTVGRDFVWPWVRLEPRATFGVRSIHETKSGSWVSPCAFQHCNFPGDLITGEPRGGYKRIDVMLGARLTAVFPVAGPFAVWTMAELATPLASVVTPDDDETSGAFSATTGRIALGGRIQL